MGSFYTNITLRATDQTRVLEALRSDHREAFVSQPINGYTVVYDRDSEDQDPEVLNDLASSLSSKLHCPALAVLNHDDDVLLCTLHENGNLVDEYNSSPGYFESGAGEPPEGGDAARLCRAFGVADVAAVENVLRESSSAAGGTGFDFEFERHEALVKALRLPAVAVGTGYNYIDEGELPEGTTTHSFARSR